MQWNFEAGDAKKAYQARADLLAYLASRAEDDEGLDDAAIVFGELVGNVVRHAPGAISIALRWENDAAVLQVSDRGPGFDWSGTAELPPPLEECGRGLFIASHAALALEVRRIEGGGSEVTAWLPVYRSARWTQRAS